MKLSILGKLLLNFVVISAWLNLCGTIMQSRLHYERNGQIYLFFGKKGMEIKKENTKAEKERRTNRRNGRKVESNNKHKVRKRKKKFELDARKKSVANLERWRFSVSFLLCVRIVTRTAEEQSDKKSLKTIAHHAQRLAIPAIYFCCKAHNYST
jgi:hypothetical protein